MNTMNVEWKQEPASPGPICEDAWLFDDSTADDLTAFEPTIKNEGESDIKIESKAQVVSRLLEDLNSFENLDDLIKEEHFSNWLGDKVEIPIFEEIPIESPQCTVHYKQDEPKPITYPQPSHVFQDTNMLLREFDTMLNAYEVTHGQLTPPQSPPRSETQVLTNLTTLMMPVTFEPQATSYFQLSERIPVELQPGTPQPDVARELAMVDEIIRSQAENLVDSWEDRSGTSTEPQSPSSSSISGFSECSSDPEWIPEPVQSNLLVEKPTRSRKRASKPYARAGPEDKKSRKKEQNKNAATRYRQKKKAEVEEILSDERSLVKYNEDMSTKVTDLKREIKYLKGLMRDLFKAKGLI